MPLFFFSLSLYPFLSPPHNHTHSYTESHTHAHSHTHNHIHNHTYPCICAHNHTHPCNHTPTHTHTQFGGEAWKQTWSALPCDIIGSVLNIGRRVAEICSWQVGSAISTPRLALTIHKRKACRVRGVSGINRLPSSCLFSIPSLLPLFP